MLISQKLYHFDEMFDNIFKPNECYKEYFKWLQSEDLKNLKKNK